MRERPPASVVVFIAGVALMLLFLLAMVVAGLWHPAVALVAVVVAVGLVGLYRGVWLAWLLLTIFHAANLLAALLGGAPWPGRAVSAVLLALLLAPPTTRHVRGAPSSAVKEGGRGRRVLRLAVATVAGLLLVAVVAAALMRQDAISGDLDLVRGNRPGSRLLLVGNRLIADNSMTTTIKRVATGDARAPAIFAVRYARPGSTLQDALGDSRLRELLSGERWSHVVLQEHSQSIDAGPGARAAHVLPAATALDALARGAGARTIVFSAPGYERGDRDRVPGDTRQTMYARIARASRELAARIGADIAPVGLAWEAALRAQPRLELWRSDGIRPSETGSYLTACVIYAVVTRRDPSASGFTGGLDADRARWLQRVAAWAVRATRSLAPAPAADG